MEYKAPRQRRARPTPTFAHWCRSDHYQRDSLRGPTNPNRGPVICSLCYRCSRAISASGRHTQWMYWFLTPSCCTSRWMPSNARTFGILHPEFLRLRAVSSAQSRMQWNRFARSDPPRASCQVLQPLIGTRCSATTAGWFWPS
jgi:hypothetical protein